MKNNDCIVRLEDENGQPQGTGFVIGEELAVTCAHVVENCGAGPNERVSLMFHAGGERIEAEVHGWHPKEDVAFLRLPSHLPAGVAPAALKPSARYAEASIRTFGYPGVGKIEGTWGNGELSGPVKEEERALLQIDSTEITKGFSGGPVWDTETDQVVGMVTKIAEPDEYDRLGEVAFAIPARTLRNLCPEGEQLQQSRILPTIPLFLKTPAGKWISAILGATLFVIGTISAVLELSEMLDSIVLVFSIVGLSISLGTMWHQLNRCLDVFHKRESFAFSQDWVWIAASVMSLVLLITTGKLTVNLARKPSSPPKLESEDFNIAIAKFSQGPEGRRVSSLGSEMAYNLRDELRSSLSEMGYGPENVDIEVFDTVGASSDRAENLLNEVTGDLPKAVTLLVYGYVSRSQEGRYVIYFLLRDPQEAMELGDALSEKLEDRGSNDDGTEAVANRSQVIVFFSRGLVELYAGYWTEARDLFQRSIDEAQKVGLTESLDTLYFFKGRTLAALENSEGAEQAYRTALSYNNQYAMAYIGLGNSYYGKFAKAYPDETVGCKGLDRALEEYQVALDCDGAHYMSWVRGKAYVNIGNVHSLCGQILGERETLQRAVEAYTSALDEYQKVNAGKEYLALAHYTRGIAYERLELWEDAIRDYDWCAANAGTRRELRGDCSQRLDKIRSQTD